MGSCSLLQGTFPTQGSNLGLLHCRRILYQLSHLRSRWCPPISRMGRWSSGRLRDSGQPPPTPGAIGLGISLPGAQFCDPRHVASDHSTLLCLLLTNGENQDSLCNLLGLVQNVIRAPYYNLVRLWDFPDGPAVKNPACNAENTGSVPGKGTKIPPAAEQLNRSPYYGATTRVHTPQWKIPHAAAKT